MIDFTNGNNNRYNPDVYIKTKSGSILAFIKIMEAIAASIGLIILYIGAFGISAALNNYFLELSNALSGYLPSSAIRATGILAQLPLLIPPLFLLLIILDGIGTFMLRFADRGESLVRFVHFIRWILSIIEIILFIATIIYSLNGASKLNDAFGSSAGILASIGILGFFLYPLTAVNFGILLFKCNYHHDICTVLKTVHEEKRKGQLALVGENHFMGRTGWLAWGSGFAFASNAFLLIYPLVTHRQLVSEESWRSISNLAPIITQSIVCLFSFLVFLKYLSLRICARNFRKYHEYKGRKSSALGIIILVILLCIAAYAIGKGSGFKTSGNQKPYESISTIRTSTPSTSNRNISATATPVEIRNSLPTPTTAPSISTSSTGGVDPDLKAFLDEYEKFMDEYAAFMKRYSANPTDWSLLTQYYSMLSKMEEYSEAADRYSEKESEMSAADLAYFTAVMMRINNKLLSVY